VRPTWSLGTTSGRRTWLLSFARARTAPSSFNCAGLSAWKTKGAASDQHAIPEPALPARTLPRTAFAYLGIHGQALQRTNGASPSQGRIGSVSPGSGGRLRALQPTLTCEPGPDVAPIHNRQRGAIPICKPGSRPAQAECLGIRTQELTPGFVALLHGQRHPGMPENDCGWHTEFLRTAAIRSACGSGVQTVLRGRLVWPKPGRSIANPTLFSRPVNHHDRPVSGMLHCGITVAGSFVPIAPLRRTAQNGADVISIWTQKDESEQPFEALS
jgi:hypothetical protein